MPVCVSCGENYDENDRYCPICGSPTTIDIATLETATSKSPLLLFLSLYLSSAAKYIKQR